MCYSYVEIEYIATRFSPARTDLAVKLLIICTSCSAVVALAVKPNFSLYHAMKFLQLSLSLAIGQVLVLAIKVWYYMAVVGCIDRQGQRRVVVSWLLFLCRACCAESNGSDELRNLGHRPGG
jgi:hypothetical protein